ncbi:Protein of unknown function [Lentzea xinjiangensis]|uniref:DUF3040 domain-containing protein n=1 Tax=Lentzea xinjiangensis TaxID=402600 RepID=A0A1H9RVG4_9PSEU|nr:DUF3040 domain-containing protein [Lentzea xinjiangensis]SER76425.1 Protein of unknown function [Lentzea xinjiangensis]
MEHATTEQPSTRAAETRYFANGDHLVEQEFDEGRPVTTTGTVRQFSCGAYTDEEYLTAETGHRIGRAGPPTAEQEGPEVDRTTEHDDERRLAGIEQELAAADPALAAALSTVSPLRRLVWPWMALAVFGTVLLLVGFLVTNAAVVLLGTGCALVGSLVVAKSPGVEETRNRI